MKRVSAALAIGSFGLQCAARTWDMWQGGNQWAGYDSFISFFRHVAKLELDYTKWQLWETLAEVSGPRIMHADFCMISDRPEILTVDDQNRPHGENGPFCQWRDGAALYAWHGVRVPWWVIEHPEQVTKEKIQSEQNAEVKRVMIERYGQSRYLIDIGADAIDKSAFGILYRALVPGDEDLVMVRVLNSTPEESGTLSRDEAAEVFDGKTPVCHDGMMLPLSQVPTSLRFKDYFIRVPPTMRRARQAVAWTFGMEGKEYNPVFQS